MSYRLTTAIRIGHAANGILRKVQSFPAAIYVGSESDWAEREHIGVEPMLLALSMELALKAWYVFDYDEPEPVRGHDLLKLFEELKPESQRHLDRAFRQEVAPNHPDCLHADYGIAEILHQHKDAFVSWRYLHERKTMQFNLSGFEATLGMVIAEFNKRYRVQQGGRFAVL